MMMAASSPDHETNEKEWMEWNDDNVDTITSRVVRQDVAHDAHTHPMQQNAEHAENIQQQASLLTSSSSSFRFSSTDAYLPPVLQFQAEICADLQNEDGLVILGRGLGLVHLLYNFVHLHACSARIVFCLNFTAEQVREINERLTAEDLEYFDKDIYSNSPSSPTLKPTNEAENGTSTLLGTDNSTSLLRKKPITRLHNITADVSVADRQNIYLYGGCIAITSRILIVDLLNRVVSPDLVNGLLINRAHQCTDISTEAFIVRVLRAENNHAFTKAFSDEASSFQHGFFKADKIMKALKLRRLLLYPRFHTSVQESLSASNSTPNLPPDSPGPDVVELYPSLTPCMNGIQKALVDCMDLCVTTLKSENKLGNQTISSVKDSDLTKAFDQAIRAELDPIWHKVSPRSKQLISDLATLRQCITYLISYDAVTFYQFLMVIKNQCSQQSYSLWLFTEPADRLFKLAKQRVFKFHSPYLVELQAQLQNKNKESQQLRSTNNNISKNGSSKRSAELDEKNDEPSKKSRRLEDGNKSDSSTPEVHIELILEENPKWNLLVDVLKEIEAEIDNSRKASDSGSSSSSVAGRVMICCRDSRSCHQLRRYFEIGGSRLLKNQWRRYLYSQQLKKRPMQVNVPMPTASSQPQDSASSSSSSQMDTHVVTNPAQLALLETVLLRTALDKMYIQHTQKLLLKRYAQQKANGGEQSQGRNGRQLKLSEMSVLQTSGKSKTNNRKKTTKNEGNKPPSRFRKPKDNASNYKPTNTLGMEDDDDAENGILRDVIKIKGLKEKQITIDSFDKDPEAKLTEGEGKETKNAEKPNWDNDAPSVYDLRIQLTQIGKSENEKCDEETENDAAAAKTPESIYHDFDPSMVQPLPNYQIIFHCNSDTHLLLSSFKPEYIIMYDPDVALLRELEVYNAMYKYLHVRIYFLMYEHSVEEQRYMNTIQIEKKAFDELIFQKAHMVIPADMSPMKEPMPKIGPSSALKWMTKGLSIMKDLGSDDGDIHGSAYEAYASTLKHLSDRNATSRKAGALEEVQNQGSIVVDVREFRSSLPSLLHARNVKICPCTLEVGDYILSPSLCVERKSLSDLFGSFLSGRLYKQIAIMSRHYKSPILLIEFDRSRPFMLLTRKELGSEISAKHIISKLSLLILHFPQLRFIWARDSYATTDTFIHLKQGLSQPSLDQALVESEPGSGIGTVGVSDFFGSSRDEDTEESSTLMTSYDVLRKLPGVNANNIRLIIQSVTSLRDLCSRSEEDLAAIMGETHAAKLYHFLHDDITNLFT